MEYRNPKGTAGAAIDCEINHPTYGWIPFTCDPQDNGAEFDVAALHAQLSADHNLAPYVPAPPPPPPAPPTAEELLAKLTEIQTQIAALQSAG